jgi:hypothetical protein
MEVSDWEPRKARKTRKTGSSELARDFQMRNHETHERHEIRGGGRSELARDDWESNRSQVCSYGGDQIGVAQANYLEADAHEARPYTGI